MTRTTLFDKFMQADGRSSGFDYLRIALSVCVIISHSPGLVYGQATDIAMWNSPMGPIVKLILPMFFALSGYLVTGSFQRAHSLVRFIGLRLIRIYPALIVEVVISALLLGPMLTKFHLRDYFTDPLFFHYLLNVTGDIHYFLPGVFIDSPRPNIVNPQLWTVPFELVCYVVIATLMLFGLRRYPWFAFAAGLGVTTVYILAELVNHHGTLPIKDGAVHGSTLVSSFLFGVGLYLYNKSIPWSPGLCLLSAVAAVVLLALPNGEYIAVIFAAYFTISLGLFNPRRVSLLRGADYSYGIYLYGAVIQQSLIAVLPGARTWWANILLAVPIATIIAALSWHFVEKPALRLRTYLPKPPAHAQFDLAA